MKITVEGYSGYKANESPLRFCLRDHWYEVRELADRWYGPDYAYFRVRADDGHLYVLRLDERTQEWSLASYRSGPAEG